uniref:Uncharacterized protein n=1 Tax=Aureoumbra lagunensis TaxID=44058 RepID=A0A7S3NPI8_9STRA|mmetsp:Transcript_7773/g.10834  ORF Transcript_7773/g.10834 Transcript_7773/m.10834 type:complete len:253 (+) Transcript_7773:16-774(+)
MLEALISILPCSGHGGCGFDTDETSILSRYNKDRFEESPPATPPKPKNSLRKVDSFNFDDAMKTPNLTRFLAPVHVSCSSSAPRRCPNCGRSFSASVFSMHLSVCHKRESSLKSATRLSTDEEDTITLQRRASLGANFEKVEQDYDALSATTSITTGGADTPYSRHESDSDISFDTHALTDEDFLRPANDEKRRRRRLYDRPPRVQSLGTNRRNKHRSKSRECRQIQLEAHITQPSRPTDRKSMTHSKSFAS